MSKAVRFDEYGPIDVLRVEDVPDPEPAAGQAVVRVRAAGINPGEAKIRDGSLHEMWPSTFPSGQGSDLAGVVERVGAGVDGVAVGDEVLGWTDERGAQAELVAVDAGQLVPKPAAVGWEIAGALYVAGATAWAAVRAVAVSSGDTVVISGAAGGVGVFAVQLAVERGARVIALASEPHHAWLRDHGAIPVTYGDGVAARVRDAAPDGVDALLDLYGPPYVDLAFELGVAGERIDTIADFPRIGVDGVKGEGNAAGASPETMRELAARVADGRLEVPIAATYPLDDVRDAYTELAEGHTLGKIVLLP